MRLATATGCCTFGSLGFAGTPCCCSFADCNPCYIVTNTTADIGFGCSLDFGSHCTIAGILLRLSNHFLRN